MNREIRAIVTDAGRANYVPVNVPVIIVLDPKGLPYAIHRQSDGAGTFLFNPNERKQIKFDLLP